MAVKDEAKFRFLIIARCMSIFDHFLRPLSNRRKPA